MPPVGPNSTFRYPPINSDVDIVCESESDYREIENDHGSVDNTFPYLPSIPVVTPTGSFHTSADANGQSDLGIISTAYGPNHAGGEVWPCFECMPPIFSSTCSSKQDMSPLKPRRKSPIVRMGNQSFHYLNSDDLRTVVHQRDDSSRGQNQITAGMPNISSSGNQPFSICDSSTIGDISLSGIDDNSVQCDPLDIFLEEMGDDTEYEEDMKAYAVIEGDNHNDQGEGP